MFDYTDLRFTVSGQSKQTSKQHTHANGQCSVTSVGLAQARLKVNLKCNALFLWYIAHLKVNLKRNALFLWYT